MIRCLVGFFPFSWAFFHYRGKARKKQALFFSGPSIFYFGKTLEYVKKVTDKGNLPKATS